MQLFKNPSEVTLKKLVAALIDGSSDPFIRVKRIHDWITLRIAYDANLLQRLASGRHPQGSIEVYTLLRYRRTNCAGFARLFRSMCRLAGIKSVIINGWIKSTATVGGVLTTHDWNAVQINGSWYMVDCSSNSRSFYTRGKSGRLMRYSQRCDHLFISPAAKRLAYLARDPAWQLAQPVISYETFHRAPRVSISFAKYGLSFRTDLQRMRKTRRIKEGSILRLSDCFLMDGSPVELDLNTPRGVFLNIYLLDRHGKPWPEYVTVLHGTGSAKLRVSAPQPGGYTVIIHARDLSAPGTVKEVYRFHLDARRSGNRIKATAEETYAAPLLGVSITQISRSGDGRTIIKIAAPREVAAVSVVRNRQGVPLQGVVAKKRIRTGWQFTYSLPKEAASIGISAKAYPDRLRKGFQRVFTVALPLLKIPVLPADSK